MPLVNLFSVDIFITIFLDIIFIKPQSAISKFIHNRYFDYDITLIET